jgi:hypothetical protein
MAFPDKDHLSVGFSKSHPQVLGRVHAQSGKEKPVGFSDAPGRASQTFAFGIVSYGDQYLENCMSVES